jgi:phosphoribosyl-AMP cyclohydrolase
MNPVRNFAILGKLTNGKIKKGVSNGMKKTKFDIRKLKFDKQKLIPAVIQDYRSGEILMLAYMNLESIRRTLKLGKTCFWSRSRREYWVKGATSGNYQHLKSIAYDCDMDALLIKVRQVGVACHTGNRSCFYRKIK